MSGAPEKDADRATQEDSAMTEAARVVGRHQARPFDGEAPLQAIKATIQFGGLVAVNALDMSVQRGEIYGLIGPNGAGKTTVFNLLTGVYKPTSGEIYFQGKRIDGPVYEISVRRRARSEHQAVSEYVGAGKRDDGLPPSLPKICSTRFCACRGLRATSASIAVCVGTA